MAPARSTPPSRPAHRPSAREAMLDAAEAHLGADGTLTLDSAARAAGVTKPGLMYHFSTKEQLLGAILDRMAARYERELLAQVAARHPGAADDLADAPADLAEAPADQRHLAYLDWACTAALSAADLVIFADPHLRVTLTERWQEQVETWLNVPAGVAADRRARLLAVRLMADGLWFDRAAGLLDEVGEEAERLRSLATALLEEATAGGEAR
ncbi:MULTISPECIES: TetR/AcrR family transcriptional regulator [Brachybacterium]|uniref:TetR/AcrR family transcriptional regulator n=2 Tax=Brachybacterium TaxID=43668 RepID=A0A426SMA0_9MICO|nr:MULTISPECIES: TetR/AcrR family transcriptional regulator [Brachybacterium]MCT1436494.1 TetR/AcrR family transcriptional regulator [Brachybacterium paraconglomeratum]RRR19261.1 TetR/AcrR family transcriptional regulator [Brachybacterium paraconglomeratum]GLI29727.1 TetR family transcriptional regulator [Brachybacterium conglomeratum]GLK05404.1 TetR family transcriptional regulator [Brachybacterium conglomeratum]